jgi:outer membrane immunogenic protein
MEFMMRIHIAAALLAATVATPAFAQDGSPFTGVRVEAIVGADRVKVEGGHDTGAVYGVGVGYDFQVGGAVIGIEGEAADSTVKECVVDSVVIGDELCANAKRDLYVGGRVGGVIGSNTLLYAKGGYTNARVGLNYDDGGPGVNDFDEAGNLDGFRVGAGIEHRLGSNTFVKAEYRYSNYEQGFARHQVVGGVGFRF